MRLQEGPDRRRCAEGARERSGENHGGYVHRLRRQGAHVHQYGGTPRTPRSLLEWAEEIPGLPTGDIPEAETDSSRRSGPVLGHTRKSVQTRKANKQRDDKQETAPPAKRAGMARPGAMPAIMLPCHHCQPAFHSQLRVSLGGTGCAVSDRSNGCKLRSR